ncbi:MAG TPA: helix-turn-helix domain-containing protein [Streptosporangiaceae bacterium]
MAIGDDRYRGSWQKAVCASRDITGKRYEVAVTISLHARRDGTNALVSIPELAETTGMSERSVRMHLSWLRSNGWLSVTHRGHRRGDGQVVPNVYCLALPTLGVASLPAIQTAGREPSLPANGTVSTGKTGGSLPATQTATSSRRTYPPEELSPPLVSRLTSARDDSDLSYDEAHQLLLGLSPDHCQEFMDEAKRLLTVRGSPPTTKALIVKTAELAVRAGVSA